MRPWRRASRTARVLVILGLLITLVFAVLAICSPTRSRPYAEDQYRISSTLSRPTAPPSPSTLPERGPPSRHVPVRHHGAVLDVFSRVILGARAGVRGRDPLDGAAMLIGVPLGLISGYVGGRFDRVPGAAHGRDLRVPVAAAVDHRRVHPEGEARPGPAVGGRRGRRRLHPAVLPGDPQPHAVGEAGAVRRGRPLTGRQAPRTVIGRYVFFNVVQSVPVIFTLNAADARADARRPRASSATASRTRPAEWGLDVSAAA